MNSPFGIVLGHNGNLTNTEQLKNELFRQDLRHVNTNSDSEVLLNVRTSCRRTATHKLDAATIFAAVSGVYRRCRGAYAVVAMIAATACSHSAIPPASGRSCSDAAKRERLRVHGRVRERARSTLGFELVRDVGPGEAIFHRPRRQLSQPSVRAERTLNPCIFEFVYLARPDSVIDGISVYETRLRMGEPRREDPARATRTSTSTS